MKKMIMMAMMMAMTITANAMSYNKAKGEALFLSDKMAYELNLTDAQYNAVYEINLDYLMSVNGRNDAYGIWWNRRNTDLMYVLTAWQYNKYVEMNYFYRPITWAHGNWTFTIYNHYSNRNHFYNVHPKAYANYKGGNNHRGDRYYADKKVDKPHDMNNGHRGDNKNNGHRGGSIINNNNGHNNNGHNNNGHINNGHNNNQLMARNNNNAHQSVRGGGR